MRKTLRSTAGPAALFLTALACLALALPAHAQWKWRDARGQITISDTPPPRDIPTKDILQQPDLLARKPAAPPEPASAASAASVVAAKPAVDPVLEQRMRQAEQEKAARAKADEKQAAADRKDNCRRAQEQLATLDSGMRIARVKPNGEREYLDDASRAQEVQRARQIIASECR